MEDSGQNVKSDLSTVLCGSAGFNSAATPNKESNYYYGSYQIVNPVLGSFIICLLYSLIHLSTSVYGPKGVPLAVDSLGRSTVFITCFTLPKSVVTNYLKALQAIVLILIDSGLLTGDIDLLLYAVNAVEIR